MSQEFSKWIVNGIYVGYNPFTNHLLNSWDILVLANKDEELYSKFVKRKRPYWQLLGLVSALLGLTSAKMVLRELRN